MITNIILHATITAYVATGHLAANNHFPTPRHTIAASRNIPLGSTVIVEGVGTFIAEDRLNKRYDKRFDIFFLNHRDAISFGKQTNKVTIIRKDTK